MSIIVRSRTRGRSAPTSESEHEVADPLDDACERGSVALLHVFGVSFNAVVEAVADATLRGLAQGRSYEVQSRSVRRSPSDRPAVPLSPVPRPLELVADVASRALAYG